jgi:plastocyanin
LTTIPVSRCFLARNRSLEGVGDETVCPACFGDFCHGSGRLGRCGDPHCDHRRHGLQPASLTARVGDTVRFVNDDVSDHVVPTAGHAVDLGTQEPGTEKTLPLMKAGSFEVECVIHDHMLLTVEVEP